MCGFRAVTKNTAGKRPNISSIHWCAIMGHAPQAITQSPFGGVESASALIAQARSKLCVNLTTYPFSHAE
jgi:hypothetical protein